MKVAIIGASGQLGFDLARIFRTSFEVVEWNHRDFDVCEKEKVEKAIKSEKPNVIFNTAAFHKVQECELNPEKSFKINTIGALNVASASASVGAVTFFISTDYVFGNNAKSFSESDIPNPLNIYGASKLSGEQLTMIANPSSYIIRTSALFGEHTSRKGHNFVTLMLKLAREKREIRVVKDQFTSPTYSFDLAEKIREIVLKKPSFSVYHITNQGSCSWYDFAKKIFELKNIVPNFKSINSNEVKEPLTRPFSSILINKKIKENGIKPMRSWEKALSTFLKDI